MIVDLKKIDNFFKKIFKEKKVVYFALEEIKVSSIKDLKKIKQILKIKKYSIKNHLIKKYV